MIIRLIYVMKSGFYRNKKGDNFRLASLAESHLQKLACLTFRVQTKALSSPLIIRCI